RPDGHPSAAGRSEESLRISSGACNSVISVPVRQGAPPSNEGDVGQDSVIHEGAGRMVLMVDDDPDVRTSVARGLRHSGFDVRVASHRKEALRLLSTETHDALVLDVQMPELDGVAVVTALRALGNDIPI